MKKRIKGGMSGRSRVHAVNGVFQVDESAANSSGEACRCQKVHLKGRHHPLQR